ncbi:MAG: hypothetical protein ACK4KV_17955 [Rhodocyclaceae bacterium]
MNGAILYPMEADDYIFILKKLTETDRIAVVMEVPTNGTDNIEELKYRLEYWTEMQDIVSADPYGFRLGVSREYNPVGEAEFQSERFSVPDDGNDLSIEIIYPNNYAAVWMVACAFYSSYHLMVVDRASLRGDAASFFRRTGVLNAVFGRLYFRDAETYFKEIDAFIASVEFCIFGDLGSDGGLERVLFVKDDSLFGELSRSDQLAGKLDPFSWDKIYFYVEHEAKVRKEEERKLLFEKEPKGNGGEEKKRR